MQRQRRVEGAGGVVRWGFMFACCPVRHACGHRFGSKARAANIPPYSTLIYRIELLKITGEKVRAIRPPPSVPDANDAHATEL